MDPVETRFDRQQSLIPTEVISRTPVTIIGVGAIGRQLAIQLAAMGVRQFQLIDFDQVDWPNVAAQGFATSDVGRAKVDAVAGAIFDYDPKIHIDTIQDRWRPKHHVHDSVFSCVDSIAARSAIWKSIRHRCQWWADARMLGDVIRVLVATDAESKDHYQSTLFEPSQAQQGTCTARSTIYSASIAAGLICHQFARWLRGEEVSSDVLVSLNTMEIFADIAYHEPGG